MSKATLYAILGVAAISANPLFAEQQILTEALTSAETPIESLRIPVNVPWSSSVKPHSAEDHRIVAVVSHGESYFELWRVNNDRSMERISRHEEIGYHPDAIYWTEWHDNDGQDIVLLLVVEGDKEIQLWRWRDEQLVLDAKIKTEYPPIDIGIGDLDNDGLTDLVIGPYDDNPLQVLRSRGDFSFDSLLLDIEGMPLHPRLVDWNQDGKMDIAWSEYMDEEGEVAVALQQSIIPATVESESPDNTETDDTETEDSAEESSDIAQRKDEKITPAFQLEVIWRKAKSEEPGTLHLPPRPRMLAPADIDGDGAPDLVVATELGGGAVVLYNDGNGGLRESELIPAGRDGYTWATVTYNSDEIPTVVLTNTKGLVLARRIEGGWERRALEIGNRLLLLDVDVEDLDGDGHEDAMFSSVTSDQVEILFGPLWDRAIPLEAEQTTPGDGKSE